jgi:hypothetical protein
MNSFRRKMNSYRRKTNSYRLKMNSYCLEMSSYRRKMNSYCLEMSSFRRDLNSHRRNVHSHCRDVSTLRLDVLTPRSGPGTSGRVHSTPPQEFHGAVQVLPIANLCLGTPIRSETPFRTKEASEMRFLVERRGLAAPRRNELAPSARMPSTPTNAPPVAPDAASSAQFRHERKKPLSSFDKLRMTGFSVALRAARPPVHPRLRPGVSPFFPAGNSASVLGDERCPSVVRGACR